MWGGMLPLLPQIPGMRAVAQNRPFMVLLTFNALLAVYTGLGAALLQYFALW
jgi:hypothetical protein